MNNYTNPYLIRASETVESDDVFLRLLAPEPLNRLLEIEKNGLLWGKILYVRSSPGGGKTTLLRLFSPSVLSKITTRYKELHSRLTQMGIKDGNRILRLGVYSMIGRDFSFVESDDIFNKTEQKQIFFALLNVRILLATLRCISIFLHLKREELVKVEFNLPDVYGVEQIKGKNALELLEWARNIESQIMTSLDDFDGNCAVRHNSLFVFDQLKASYFSYDGNPICVDFIFQIDDAHKLTESQKRYLREELIENRKTATVWIAERLESLTTTEILEDNNVPQRDYDEIRLDDSNKYIIPLLKKVSEVRSNYSTSGINLASALSENNPDEVDSKYKKIINNYQNRIRCCSMLNMVESWFDLIDLKSTLREKAIYYRSVLVFLSRKQNRDYDGQLRMFPYEAEDMEGELKHIVSQVERFFENENNLIAYYGEKTLYEMSSYNIEQFLSFASCQYNLLLSKKLSSPNHYDLTTAEQDKIYKDECLQRYDNLKRLKGGVELINFINHLMEFCRQETFSDSHSYLVVSGFAVQEENKNSKMFWFQEKENKQLANVLRLCLAYNLLTKLETFQGGKEQKWTVFYMNRWLCVVCGIPLDRGGWRKISTKKLKLWM